MANEYMKDMAAALCNVISRHLQEAEHAREQGQIHWYWLHSSLTALLTLLLV